MRFLKLPFAYNMANSIGKEFNYLHFVYHDTTNWSFVGCTFLNCFSVDLEKNKNPLTESNAKINTFTEEEYLRDVQSFIDSKREEQQHFLRNAEQFQDYEFIDFHYEKFENLDFRNVYLPNINFESLTLEGLDFQNTYLTGASFKDTRISHTNFQNANLKGANFLIEKEIFGLDRQKFRGAELEKALFNDKSVMDFERRGAYLIVDFAELKDADLKGRDLSGQSLKNADLRGADLSHSNLTGTNLSEADLDGADLSNSNLSGANLKLANIIGANLEGSIIDDAKLSGALYDKTTKLPDYMSEEQISQLGSEAITLKLDFED